MKKIKTENVTIVEWCPLRTIGDTRMTSVEKCEKCSFCGGNENGEITCYRAGLATLNHIHVTEFTHGQKTYRARYYDKDIDGEIEGDDPYDYCQKCDMKLELPNGEWYCLMRQCLEPIDPFICYEGEIWKLIEDKSENAEK